MPLLLVPALASVSAPHPAPEGLLPQFWAVAFYGAFYALGALLREMISGRPLFDLRSGRPLSLPATRPVPVYLVTVEGERVLVDAATVTNR